MNDQHLSDEAVAAFADGVLTGFARERATRHTDRCAECAQAIRVQREAAWTLRVAGAPPLPSGLLDRLRTVPQTTELRTLPTVLGPDGSTMLATSTRGSSAFSPFAPMAAFVPPAPAARAHRSRPIATTAAVVALTGALAAGPLVQGSGASSRPGTDQVVHRLEERGGTQPLITPVTARRTLR